MNRYALGNNIVSRLEEIGMTQYRLAAKLGINQGTLSKWVNGLREPKASALYKISKILGVTIDELMKGVDDDSDRCGGNRETD